MVLCHFRSYFLAYNVPSLRARRDNPCKPVDLFGQTTGEADELVNCIAQNRAVAICYSME